MKKSMAGASALSAPRLRSRASSLLHLHLIPPGPITVHTALPVLSFSAPHTAKDASEEEEKD